VKLDMTDGAERVQSPNVAPKKRYSKPAFRMEKVFETRALSCGKISSTQPQCTFNLKAS